jgi:hypothetical protein
MTRFTAIACRDFFEYGFVGEELVESAADLGLLISFFKYTTVASPPQRMRQPM